MLRAALLLILGMTLVPLGDTAAKILVSQYGVSPVFSAWTRFAFGAVIALPFVTPGHLRAGHLADWRVILRGLLIVGGITSIMMALKTEPLPNVFGAFFIGPILSYVLSVRLLGESISTARSALLLLGFLGVLLVVKPGFGMTPGLGFAILAGAFYGSYLTASRWLSPAIPPRALLLGQLVTGAIVLMPFAMVSVPSFSGPVISLILASAVLSMSANLLLILAYALAPATRLAPFVYFQLVGAVFFGWAVFGDIPDPVTLSGLALLLLSGFASLALRR